METRREQLQAWLAHARRTGDPTVPLDVLMDLTRRWYTTLAARLDEGDQVRQAYDRLSAEDPTWRWVLDHYRDHPVVADTAAQMNLEISRLSPREVVG
ncbi:hypothetical protein ACIBH1_44090 [Nonomuraea sp. NPDC050663]|uniref:hypothetical protein n=1 Tax=Nonomuraea sp. NPDC050663 TaxID=3364370 RepID=UPI0037B4D47A